MMKKLLILLCIMAIGFTMVAYAQDTANDNNTGYEDGVATDTARQFLREISITTFEDPTLWTVKIPVDKGYVEKRRMAGSPEKITDETPDGKKKPLELEAQINGYKPIDDYVLGVKAGFYARDLITVSIEATEAIYMPGIVKVVSVWVAGRGKDHMLSAIIRGMNGQIMKLPMGKLNFFGWNQMEIQIPGDLSQTSLGDNLYGAYFLGFAVDTVFEQTIGTYYIYFDDLRVLSDVIHEAIASEEKDDMSDGW